MRHRLTIFLALVLVVAFFSTATSQALTDAFNAFSAHDIQRALELFEKVFADENCNVEDRVQAAGGAAVLNWRYFKHHEIGREILQKALALETDASGILTDLARLERYAGRFTESLDAASRACLLAETPRDAIAARLSYATTVVLPHSRAAKGIIADVPEALRGKLPLAHEILRAMVKSDPGDLPSSNLLVLSGILLGDGDSTLEGWRSYFRIAEGVSAGRILDEAGARLTENLAGWKGMDAGIEQNIAIARAFEASRMYDPASLLIALYIPADQRPGDLTDVLNYGLFTHALTELTDEYYRMTALGKGDYQTYFTAVLTMIKNTWNKGSWADEPFPIEPPFTPENVSSQQETIKEAQQRVLERFGAYVSLGKTAGFNDLHYGHVVVDDNRTIEQYGRRAEVRFLLLDGMVSNGFQSWAWDYRSQHGGWANEIGIFQIRPAYADGPMNIWRVLNDSKQLEEWLERMERNKREDVNRAKGNDIVYLQGVQNQLRYTAILQLLDGLKAEGLSSAELQKRFIAELTHIQQEFSIFAHEGRHFIDKLEGISGSEELEFRAKLSEIAFSPSPKMALAGAIFSSNIGAETPHGQANARVMKGIVDWMIKNAEQIDGLKRDSPMLLQLDLLSDEQLRTAVRSMDPMATAVDIER